MNDIPIPQARYALIPDDTRQVTKLYKKTTLIVLYSTFLPCRKKCFQQNRYILVLLMAAIVTFVAATVYVATIGIHEKLLYPKYAEQKGKSHLLQNFA